MTLLSWKPAYSLGIPSVDLEHREMIRMINQLYAGLGDKAEADDIEDALENIYAGIASHFALEERHMRDAGYAEYQDHKDQHEDLLDQIRDMMDDFERNPEAGREILQKSLSDWFGHHFATFDARLHHQLGEHG